MTLKSLIKQRSDLNCNILNCMNDEVLAIKLSAEYMVECATNIKGQGYSTFIQAREDFLNKIDTFYNEIKEEAIIYNCTRD